MDKNQLIDKISRGESLTDSKELFEWVNHSKENERDYIRQKNLWAFMQFGKEMDATSIAEGLGKVKQRIHKTNQVYSIRNILKYAAIILLAATTGYLINTSHFSSRTAMNEINVPKGNRTSVSLPDGTKVWLNNGTKLIYPDQFNGGTRDVELKGEGYFEVAHDPKNPFMVKVGNHRVKVLGTKFSVTAYPDDEFIRADLVSGKIQFDVNKDNKTDNYNSVLINPGQSLVLVKASGKLFESKIPDGFYDYWHRGIYKFENETFENLAKKMNRIYNVEVIFEDEKLKQRLFTGTLSIDDNIYTMMEVFKRASGNPFEYTHERDKIYIRDKN